MKRPRLKQIPHLRRSPPQRKLPSQPAAKSRRKRRPFSSFPCSHFCLSPWLLPTAACSKATLPQKRESVSSAAGTEYFWKMETIPSAQKISVALPAPLKRVVRLQFHSQNAPFLIYPYLTYSPEKTKAVNDGEKLAGYCYDVKSSDDPDASAFGYAFVSDDTFSVVILSDPELSFAFTASDKS